MDFMQILRDVALFNVSLKTSKIAKGITSIENLIQEFGIEFNKRIERLREDMNKHLTNITTELAIQSRIFENIQQVLVNKRVAEAEELKTLGIKALRNGWIDDAQKDFLDSLQINRYDYQVHYLLSKIYGMKDDANAQISSLNSALKYASEDTEFQQYVYLDLALISMREDKLSEAEDFIRTAEELSEKGIALLLFKLLLDIRKKNIGESTFTILREIINSYESKKPEELIALLTAVKSNFPEEHQARVDSIIKEIRSLVSKITQAECLKILMEVGQIWDVIDEGKRMLTKFASEEFIKDTIPSLNSVTRLVANIKLIGTSLENSETNDFIRLAALKEQLQLFIPALQTITQIILSSYEEIKNYPTLMGWVGVKDEELITVRNKRKLKNPNDKILYDFILSPNSSITLSMYQLFINNRTEKKYSIDISNFDSLRFEILSKRLFFLIGLGKYKRILTFKISDTRSGEVLMIDTCFKASSESIVSRTVDEPEHYKNFMQLIWEKLSDHSALYQLFTFTDIMIKFYTKIIDEFLKSLNINKELADPQIINSSQFVKCNKCGQIFETEIKFCTECGAKISG